MRQHEVAYVAREGVEYMVRIPEHLSEHLEAEVIEERNRRAQGEQAYYEQFLARRSLYEPRREHGDEHVEAQQRVEEPHVARSSREVERYVEYVVDSLLNRRSAPKQRQRAVEHEEHNHGGHYAQRAALEETCPCLFRFERAEQVGRGYHEQRHAHAAETVEQRHPEQVVGRRDFRHHVDHLARRGVGSGAQVKVFG